LTLGSRPVAAKTGTTQEYRDAWTIGYTPSLVAGVWTGNNDNSPMYRGPGAYVAAPIWQAFMKKALEGKKVEYFMKPAPAHVSKPVLLGKQEEEKVKVCKTSGKLATDLCPENFVEEKNFKEVHCILYYVDKNNPRGDPPKNPEADPQYLRWEEPVQRWAESQEFTQEKPPTEYCDLHIKANQPQVVITSPKEREKVTDYLKVSTKISAPLGISRVEFWLDDFLVYTDATYPYGVQFVPQKKQGSSSLLVRAYDKIDNKGEAEVQINLDIGGSGNEIVITNPKSNVTLDKKDFPYTILATLSNIQAQKVQFYSRESSSQGPPHLIDQVVISSKSKTAIKVSVAWPYPGTGTYQVYARVLDPKGNIHISERVEVKIL
jgi:membrane carboxypeptidase/penicillin-binding protein PbpC